MSDERGQAPGGQPAPRPAATVVLLREPHAGGAPEIFFVRRHGRSGFMPGAHVFPGGRFEPEDRALSEGRELGLSAEQAGRRLGEPDEAMALALHVTAARETLEEAAVWLGETAREAPELRALAEALSSGRRTFAEVLDHLGGRLSLDALVPLARWVTPPEEPRRYDARFFLAVMPSGQQARHDGRETTEGRRLTAAAALDALQRGELWLAPPTLRTVEWLARFDSAGAALEAAASRPPPKVDPVLRRLASGEVAICLPGDPLHPGDGAPVVEGPCRIVLREGRFRSEPPA